MVIAVVVSLVFINLIPLQSVMLKQEILAEKEKMRNLWNLNILSDNKKGLCVFLFPLNVCQCCGLTSHLADNINPHYCCYTYEMSF